MSNSQLYNIVTPGVQYIVANANDQVDATNVTTTGVSVYGNGGYVGLGSYSTPPTTQYTIAGVFSSIEIMQGHLVSAYFEFMNGTSVLNSNTGTANITLGSSKAHLVANDTNVSVYSQDGQFESDGSADVNLWGSASSLIMSGTGGSNNNVALHLDGGGTGNKIVNESGNIGITVDGGTTLTTSTTTGLYLTASNATLNLATGTVANVTAVKASANQTGDLYSHINSSGIFSSLTATAGSLTDIDFTSGYGEVNMAAGSYTKASVNFQNGAGVTVNNLTPASGSLFATGLHSLNDVAIDYVNGGALIHETSASGSIFLSNVQPGGVSLMTALNGTDFTAANGGNNTLLIALNNPNPAS